MWQRSGTCRQPCPAEERFSDRGKVRVECIRCASRPLAASRIIECFAPNEPFERDAATGQAAL